MVTVQEDLKSPTKGTLPPITREPKLFKTLWALVKPISYFDTMYQRYGDIYIATFANLPTQVLVSHPQAIQEIFTADPKLFLSGTHNQISLPLVGPNSLILLDGNPHIQQRKLLMPSFHGERMKAYGQTMRNIVKQVLNRQKIGDVFLARSMMQEISLQVILHTIFGLTEGERYQKIQQALTEMLDSFNNPLSASFLFFKFLQRDLGPWTPWGNFLRKREQLDQLLYQEISDRKTQSDPSGEDILSLLLSARDEAGEPMTDVELRDELMTMLFAGHETTASALAWALYWIHSLPEVREKLLEEINSIDIENADFTTISRLPYLSAVCSETLRIYPIAFFTLPRTLQAPMQLMGYELPAGMTLSVCIYLTHQRPDLYPEPKKFKPERFLERQFSAYEYLPFGGGNRRCLGLAFALFEMKLVLATLLSNYQFELRDNRPISPVRRGITFAPEGGVPLILKGRN